MKKFIAVVLSVIMVCLFIGCENKTVTSKSGIIETKERIKNASVGHVVAFGSYDTENIPWIVLEKTDRQALLISMKALEIRPYNTEYEQVTWESCSLRKWLNNDFINSAFSEVEREMIMTKTITADPNPKFDTDPGNDTKDKVFLLSIDEVNKYFPSKDERIRYYSSGDPCSWWLRTPGDYQVYAAVVDSDGEFFESGSNVDLARAVRPAMWIDLNK